MNVTIEKLKPCLPTALTLKKYGMTVGDFIKLMREQDWECPVCSRNFLNWALKPVIDHDHLTGEVRGILCAQCNTGIGLLCDELVIVERAVTYLKDPPAQRIQFEAETLAQLMKEQLMKEVAGE